MPIQLYAALKERNEKFCKILNGKQQDAPEFLKLVAEEMATQKHSLDWFETTFLADVKTVVKCSICKSIYESKGKVGDFAVEIYRQKSVQSALDLYFKWESVNDYDCSCCNKKVSAKKKFSFASAPACLCIYMKRFVKNRKMNTNLEITPELSISKYFVTNPVHEKKYKLVAIYWSLYHYRMYAR